MGPIKSMDAYLYKGIQTIYIISLLSFDVYYLSNPALSLYVRDMFRFVRSFLCLDKEE